ncbi:MAG: hypothetical protein ACOYW3_13420 [Bacteroidota bacterium]
MKTINRSVLALLCVIGFSCETEKSLDPIGTFYKYYGMQGDQRAADLAVAFDGSIFLLGNKVTTDAGGIESFTPYLVKTDPGGNSIWEQSFTGFGSGEAKDIEISNGGQLMIVGNTDLSGERDFFILVVNQADGSEVRRVVDGYPGFEEKVETITEISDGYIISGATTNVLAGASSGDRRDGFFFRYRADLTPYGIIWSNRYGPGTDDVAVKTIEAKPGVFYMFGYSNQVDILDQTNDFNFWVFQTNAVGQPGSLKFSPGKARTNEILTSVNRIQGTSNFLLTGVTEDGGVSELYAVKVRGDIETIQNVDDLIQQEKTLTNFGFTSDPATRALGISSNPDFIVVSSQNLDGNQDVYFSRLDSRLIPIPGSDGRIFGGAGNDSASAVVQLADGDLLVLGTIVLGEVNGQTKLALLKLNPAGKFNN